jgi:hypothetical protein
MRLASLLFGLFAALLALVIMGVLLLTQPASAHLPAASAPDTRAQYAAVPVATICSYSIVTGTATIVPGTTDIGLNCDDCVATVNLPFAYQLYGTTFVTATVSANGNLQFTGSSARSANTCLPDANFSHTIFAHWQDLATFCGNCGVFTSISGTAPNRIFNIEWRATYGFESGVELNFEVRLYEGQTKFDLIYASVPEEGVSATVGVERDQPSGQYTQYECNTLGTLSDGLKLTFTGVACGGTATPTPPAAGSLVGHVTWQGRTAQPSAAQIMAVSLTLKSAITEVNFPMALTDRSGFFTTTVSSLPTGTYNWRVKGPTYLATSGTLVLVSGTTRPEMGLQLTGDLNGDNVCNSQDFNFVKNNFGQGGAPPIGPAGPAPSNVSVLKRSNANQGQGQGPGSASVLSPQSSVPGPAFDVVTPVCSYTASQGAGVIVPGTDDTGNHCDDCVTTIPLPFPYQLYDSTFTQATVSSNGNLQLASTTPRSANTCLPALDFAYTIFPHWGDLVTDCFDCGVFTSLSGIAPARIFNIEWRAAFFEGVPVNFELRLYEGQTRFDVVYGSIPSAGAGATVGVQKDGVSFTQYECNTVGTLTEGMQLTFTGAPCGATTSTPTRTATRPPLGTPTPPPCVSRTTICHRTGSEKKPYHEITINCNALEEHLRHGDIYPVPPDGCPARLPSSTPRPLFGVEKPQGSSQKLEGVTVQSVGLAPHSVANQALLPQSPSGSAFSPNFERPHSVANQALLPRRESAPIVQGPPPRTGPASPLAPLDPPNFGANHRANTDTQSPNLAQQEPGIAVNPKNPLNVVVAAKDERSGTNTKHVWIYTSTDGGVTWLNQPFPLLTPTAQYSSDPIVNFSDDGICYVTALPYAPSGLGPQGSKVMAANLPAAPQGQPRVGIQVARSFDGGITFEPAAEVTSNGLADKEWTWVDNSPGSPFYHRIYVAWMDFATTPITVRLNYSTDRGLTWTQSPLARFAFQFPMPVSLPNGHIIVTYRALNGSNVFVRSIDGGITWDPEQSISTAPYPQCPPDNMNCNIWRLDPIPANSVNPNDGTQVLTWADGSDGTSTIRYVRSTDDGVTWNLPALLAPPGVADAYQIQPWVHSDENGTFHAIWLDDRLNPNTSIFHVYYSQSTDNGASWSAAVRISSAASDLRIGIPSSYNRAAGDYINVTAARGNVYAAWTDTRAGNGEDIYVVRGQFGGTPTSTPTGTPPTATNTRTRTSSPTRTFTPTATATVCGGGQYIITQATATIVTGGADIGNHCDDCVTGINLPFSYRLYDQTFGAVSVSSNGNLQFQSADAGGENSCLPAQSLSYAILPHWDDLRTDDTGNNYGIFTSLSGTAPNRIFNIEWLASLHNRRGDVNFQVRLYENQTRFDIIYGTMAGYGTGATVGVQHGPGLNYTQFECNTGGLGPGMMLTFVLPPCGTATPTVTGTPPTLTRTPTPTATICIGNYGYATATGTIVPGFKDTGIHCDDCTEIVFFPFPVRFYDQQFTLADISSNGNIQFTTSDPAPFNPCLPSAELEAAVMPHWDDLLTGTHSGCQAGGCGVFTSVSGSAPNRILNIEWRAVRYSNPIAPVNFEVRFYENQTRFDFVYGQVNGAGGDATVGEQNDTTRYTEFSCLTQSLSPGLLIRWTLQGCSLATSTPTTTPCASCTSTPTGTSTRTFTASPTPTGTPCGIVTYEGAITLNDPTQIGRHFRDETRSTCDAPKTCPKIVDSADRHYDSYTLTNSNATTQCVTVDVRTLCNDLQFIFAAAYLDSFNPNNICQNYLADLGLSPYPSEFMTFLVPGGHSVVIVVSEVTTNQGCPAYTLTVQGLGICGTRTPTPTGTPPTPTNTPTRTATPCGYNFVTGTATIVPGTAETNIHCDDCVAALPLPFPFTLYGTGYNTANVSSNGTIQFFTSSANHLNTCLPAPSLGVALLPDWSDYVTDCAQCGVFTSVTGIAPNRSYNIEWRAGYFKGGGSANFETRLYESTGVFEFIYSQMSDPGDNGTVGVQRPGANGFSQYECNAGGLTPGLLVRGVYQGCGSPTATPTRTVLLTHTPTVTATRTGATRTYTSSPTYTPSPTYTNTQTPIRTATNTPINTNTPPRTPTISPTRATTLTPTPTPTLTSGVILSRTPTPVLTSTPYYTGAPSLTATPTVTPTPCTITFSDVHPSDFFYEAVRYLYCRGVVAGYADNTYRPYTNTTRGQLAKIVVLAEGWLQTCTTQHFSDVPPGSPFYCYVETAYAHSIISGYADGTFHPYNNVTRAQLSKIVVLAEGWADACTTQHFSDVPPSNPFYCYVETAYAHSIISGYDDGTFRPYNNATRGQIAKIVYEAVRQP